VRANAVGAVASILEALLLIDDKSQFRAAIGKILFGQQQQIQLEADVAGTMSPPDPRQQQAPAANVFLTMVRRRISDEKANVRKAALQVLEMVGRSRFEGVSLMADDVAILQERCFDPQVGIRKQALVSLSELFKSQPDNAILRQSWVSTVPSLTFDTEQTVQDKVMAYIEELIFDAAVKGCESPDAAVWKILDDIDRGSIDAGKNLQRICLSKPVFKSLMKALEKHQIKGAWILLAHVAPFWPQLVDGEFVVSAWESTRDKKANDSDEMKVKILRVLVHVAGQLKAPVATKLTHDLVSRLEHFHTRPTVIQVAIQVASALQIALGNKSDDWMRTLLQKCDAALSASVLGSSDASGSEIESMDQLDAYLFTLGELAQRCKKETMPRRAVDVVQTLIAPSFEGLRIKGQAKDSSVRPPASSRAQAFITLGKMCLQDQSLAKSCIPVFARELETSTDSIVRNNVMVVLCDLTIRYTNLVDNYVGKIAVCLRDDSELVRRQTLMLLTNLMKEDYIKLRSGPLFFRLILLLVDDSASLRQFAGVCLDAITSRASADKNLFYNHFVESIFYLNDFRMHAVYNKFSQTDRERALFSLRGSAINQLKRMEIYKAMLSRMSDDQKFQVASQMCREILNAATENQLLVNEQSGFFVLQDALLILCSRDIKIKIAGIGSGAGDDLEDISEGSQKLMEAKGKILSKLMKKNIVESSLFHFLWCLGYLADCSRLFLQILSQS
jgi:condensin-2 complex subunit D3